MPVSCLYFPRTFYLVKLNTNIMPILSYDILPDVNIKPTIYQDVLRYLVKPEANIMPHFPMTFLSRLGQPGGPGQLLSVLNSE